MQIASMRTSAMTAIVAPTAAKVERRLLRVGRSPVDKVPVHCQGKKKGERW